MSGGERLKVALVLSKDMADYGLALAEAAASRAEILVCADARTDPAELDAIGAARIVRLERPRHRDVAGNLRLLAALARAVRAFDPHLVHVLSEGEVWLNLLPLLEPRRPLAVTLHDVVPHPGDRDTLRVPRLFARALVRRADAVVVHGERLRRDAAEVFGLPAERLFTAPHPVNWRYRRIAGPGGRPADGRPLEILFFGRIFAYKGLQPLLDALAALEEGGPRFRLTVAGRGETAPALAAAARRPDLYAVRDGTIGDGEAAALFADADVLALPYLEASQSGVLCIAPSFALPVIASDVGEMGPLVRAAGMGLLTPPGDVAALRAALERLLADAPLRRRLAAASAAAAHGALAPERVSDGLEAAWRAALARRR